MRTLAAPLALALVLASCRSTGESSADAAELARWMSGSFSSAAQAAADPGNYYDIRLRVTPIWTDRDDGTWLYVEQAAAETLERPYRQRVYHVVATTGGARSDVYELPGDPLAFAGAHATPEVFTGLGPDDLAPRDGCSIHLTRAGDAWIGETRGTGCSSRLGGAAYATSEVLVRPDLLTSWDRGFDAEDEQVWGAVAGPYEFVRVRDVFASSGQNASDLAGLLNVDYTNWFQSTWSPTQFPRASFRASRIWTTRADGPWLYVEQQSLRDGAPALRRQIYRLIETVDGVRAELHALPAVVADATDVLDALCRLEDSAIDALQVSSGRSILFVRDPDGWTGRSGSFRGRPDRAGEAEPTLEITARPGVVAVREQRLDERGELVWEPARGPLRFEVHPPPTHEIKMPDGAVLLW